MDAYTLTPVYGLQRTRRIMSGEQCAGHLYAPRAEGAPWEVWPKAGFHVAMLGVSREQFVSFPTEADALDFLGVSDAMRRAA